MAVHVDILQEQDSFFVSGKNEQTSNLLKVMTEHAFYSNEVQLFVMALSLWCYWSLQVWQHRVWVSPWRETHIALTAHCSLHCFTWILYRLNIPALFPGYLISTSTLSLLQVWSFDRCFVLYEHSSYCFVRLSERMTTYDRSCERSENSASFEYPHDC